jgi:hypothetical protein
MNFTRKNTVSQLFFVEICYSNLKTCAPKFTEKWFLGGERRFLSAKGRFLA